jgi:16S rRNA (guanine1207-N2)-methyltransferase
MNRKKTEHYFVEHPKSKLNYGLIKTCLRGRTFQFLTASGVFSKKRVDLGTQLLIESAILPERGCILDIGCGYGAVGIAVAVFNPHLQVVLTDVNERAVRLARQNAKLNNVSNIEVRKGYLYEPVEGLMLSGVLSNPPVTAGMKIVNAIIMQAPQHMSDKATFQVVVRSKIGGKRLMSVLEEAFGCASILARGSGYRVFIAEKQ